MKTDPHFRVGVLSKADRPNLQAYLDLHQCYAEKSLLDDCDRIANWDDEKLGQLVVDKCVKYGHWGVLESPAITFACEGFPHSVIVQARTHRIGVSFNVQSQRYTSKRILDLSSQLISGAGDNYPKIEELFYLRPVGQYYDREGRKYNYTEAQRDSDFEFLWASIKRYESRVIDSGFAPEHARDMLCQNIRQNFNVTFNARSLLHFCDLRLPKDAQLEIRCFADMIFAEFKKWMPEVATYYEKKRMGKNKLAP